MCMTRISDIVEETPDEDQSQLSPYRVSTNKRSSDRHELARDEQENGSVSGPDKLDWEFNQDEADRIQNSDNALNACSV